MSFFLWASSRHQRVKLNHRKTISPQNKLFILFIIRIFLLRNQVQRGFRVSHDKHGGALSDCLLSSDKLSAHTSSNHPGFLGTFPKDSAENCLLIGSTRYMIPRLSIDFLQVAAAEEFEAQTRGPLTILFVRLHNTSSFKRPPIPNTNVRSEFSFGLSITKI